MHTIKKFFKINDPNGEWETVANGYNMLDTHEKHPLRIVLGRYNQKWKAELKRQWTYFSAEPIWLLTFQNISVEKVSNYLKHQQRQPDQSH